MSAGQGICLVVGAGQAGGHAAVAARRAGFTGRIVLCGDEPSRPYERPFLSKELLLAEAVPATPFVHAIELYAELAIELRLEARIEDIDPAQGIARLADGGHLPFDHLVLATGGRPRRLAVEGAGHVHYLRTLADGMALRERLAPGLRVVVIGAGVIGLEVASSARRKGCEVVVLESAERVMGRSITASGAGFVAGLHHAAGVELRLSTTVDAIERHAGHLVLQCSNGCDVPADLVVAGIGMERNTGLATAAGITVEGGIVVDEHGRTDRANIYAAGDVAAFWHPLFDRRLMLESWKHAQNHGIHVGRQLAGMDEAYAEVPWFWSDQHGVNLQVAGLPGEAAQTLTHPASGNGRFAEIYLDRKERVVGAAAANDPRSVRLAMKAMRTGKPVDWPPA